MATVELTQDQIDRITLALSFEGHRIQRLINESNTPERRENLYLTLNTYSQFWNMSTANGN